MTTLVKTICQNCFGELNKTATQSNFCCQECFDEWILKQQMKVIKHFNNYMGYNSANNG